MRFVAIFAVFGLLLAQSGVALAGHHGKHCGCGHTAHTCSTCTPTCSTCSTCEPAPVCDTCSTCSTCSSCGGCGSGCGSCVGGCGTLGGGCDSCGGGCGGCGGLCNNWPAFYQQLYAEFYAKNQWYVIHKQKEAAARRARMYGKDAAPVAPLAPVEAVPVQ